MTPGTNELDHAVSILPNASRPRADLPNSETTSPADSISAMACSLDGPSVRMNEMATMTASQANAASASLGRLRPCPGLDGDVADWEAHATTAPNTRSLSATDALQ